MTPVSDCFVSVVAPLRNDAAIAEAFVSEVLAVLRANYSHYELLLVDDGSVDDTVTQVTSLLTQYECIRLVRLSRKFGTEIAIASGLDSVIGDFVVVMLPDSCPPFLIPEMVRQSQAEQDIVFGVRRSRAGEPLWMRWGASFFYWLCENLLDLNLPRNSTEFQVLSRRAVNAISQIRDKYRYLRLLSAYVGYANQSFIYEPISRYGKPRSRGFLEAVNLAIGIVVTNSTHPLRFVSWLSLFASVLNGLYIVYVASINIFEFEVSKGWTTLSLQNAMMFCLTFAVLTVLSEYIGRILDESKERPLYYVLEEKTSSVLLTASEQRNVVRESLQVGHDARDGVPGEVRQPVKAEGK